MLKYIIVVSNKITWYFHDEIVKRSGEDVTRRL